MGQQRNKVGPSGLHRPAQLSARFARGRLADTRVKANLSELAEALRGRVTEHHRFMLKLQLEQIAGAEAAIAQLDQRVEAHLAPLRQAVTQLTTIPGIIRVAAATLIAEIGRESAIPDFL